MRIGKGLLREVGSVLALVFAVGNAGVVLADIQIYSEFPTQKAAYSYRTDPFLLQWTFEKPLEAEVGKGNVNRFTLTEAETKRLAMWKERQAWMWENLPEGEFLVNASAYTAAADECGKSDGITASGLKVEVRRTLACPPTYPFGALVQIDGVGVLQCEDRGGAIKGNKFDIYMQTKSEAFAFGRRHLTARIVD